MAQTSEQLFAQARGRLAGGVSHESRFADPFPKYISHAKGSRKWEVDGGEYIDYAMGSASLLLGHAHRDVVAALSEQAARGSFFADCHPLEVEWAGLIQGLIPSAERVRFVGSGTEATMLAIRIARAFSGRDKILRFEGHYHGWHEFVDLGMKAPYDEASSLGILPGTLAATVVVPPDAARVAEALAADSEIGTIICEVSGANYGSVPLPFGLLEALRQLADEHDAVLIFDEVITGFRWSPGGLQARDNIIPDLTSMAKIVTGGMPGGAVGGQEKFMALLDPAHEFRGRKPAVTHKGTFNGNPLVAAAGVAALQAIKTGEPNRLADAAAARLRDGLRSIIERHQVAGAVYGEASTFHIYFGDGIVDGSVAQLGAAAIRGVPKQTVMALRNGLRQRGVDLMSHMSGVTSMAHNDADIDQTLDAFEDTLRGMIAQGLVGNA
ncbi:MAG: Glutamate-1-semialdehyde 2,1-aminomutase [Alphaproteobacteria bacterium MarineAlpha10_Bin3]|jgi:glutamate-1-semialdehyde 2,1-aminomutase|nr:MAG: Glutamate-1-semialdehyde 2,1-aminomutase [Alphaproteobacteria bacterium MarineAlpha10_Bin3]PPR66949.1 MAG: Glutamate-1-semialdehyde 2,1-aminomutase [Alphaproteobacteria bacterium MarineAlpha4_Bin1]